MNRSIGFMLALAIAFSSGWGARTLVKPAPALAAATAQPMQSESKSPADQAFMRAMMGMQHAMMNTHMSGAADHDFMVMMIPHHQSAIDMAKAELRYGKDARVRGLATSIISAQQKEIDEMQTWLAGIQ